MELQTMSYMLCFRDRVLSNCQMLHRKSFGSGISCPQWFSNESTLPFLRCADTSISITKSSELNQRIFLAFILGVH